MGVASSIQLMKMTRWSVSDTFGVGSDDEGSRVSTSDQVVFKCC